MTRRALFIPSTVGMGHVVRSRALANELANRGWQCSTSGSKRPSGFEGDVVVIDGDLAPADYDWEIPTVVIRDQFFEPDIKPVPRLYVCPLAATINSRLGICPQVLMGPAFSMIRPAFREARGRHVDHTTYVFDMRDAPGTWTEQQMAAQLMVAAVAITYAGMRAMEAACVGVPTVLLARNEGERLNGEGLGRGGAGLYLGEEEDEEAVRHAVKSLIDRPERRQGMSSRAFSMVDGRGCERVADAIEEEIR